MRLAGVASRCSSGRKRTFSPFSKAHFMTPAALELVQTSRCSPVKGFDGRGRVHVGDGMILRESRREESSLQQAFHWPMSPLSASSNRRSGLAEQPLVLAAENVRALGHAVHAAEDDVASLGCEAWKESLGSHHGNRQT